MGIVTGHLAALVDVAGVDQAEEGECVAHPGDKGLQSQHLGRDVLAESLGPTVGVLQGGEGFLFLAEGLFLD